MVSIPISSIRLKLVARSRFINLGSTCCPIRTDIAFWNIQAALKLGGLGHNGMAVYPADERPDFWTLQISTTRNITGNFLSDWFCGGLQYQVDHHLFPQLPRHNLPKVHKMVEAFCKSHSKPYHEANMWNGTIEVLTHLSEVSTEFLQEFPAM